MSSVNRHKRLVLFDVDGTLLHPHGSGRASMRRAMLEVFGTASRIGTHHFGGKTDWNTLVELLAEHGHDAESIRQQMPVYERTLAHHLAQIIVNHAVAACPGALEVVQSLRQDDSVILGLVTGNVASTAPVKLRAAGFDPAWFPVGAYGSEAVDRNELPALALQRAIAYSGSTISPEDVTVIGDTPADVASARALGAVAIAVCTGFSTREALIAARPDHLLDDLTGLLTILNTQSR